MQVTDVHQGSTERQHERPSNEDEKDIGETPRERSASVMPAKRPRRGSNTKPSDAAEMFRSGGWFIDERSSRAVLTDNSATSPQSDTSGSSNALSNATSRWFGLLATDVSYANYSFASPLLATQKASSSETSNVSPNVSSSVAPVDTSTEHTFKIGVAVAPSTIEVQLQQSAYEPEFILMRNFVNSVSSWFDFNDPQRHYSLLVPRLAMHNEGLRKAILAVSAQNLAAKPKFRSPEYQPNREVAVQYYHETLQYMQQAMKDEAFLRSDELLCIILLLSTFEAVNGARQAWDRHLRGAFEVQRSLEITGESGGLKQATWWAWLRQDWWAAYRERRKILNIWIPTKPLSALDKWGLAERSTYLGTQCVDFASEDEVEAGKMNPQMRLKRAEELLEQFEEWHRHLTPDFQPLPSPTRSQNPFKSIWIHPESLGKERSIV